MWWIIGSAIWLVLALVTYSLCRAAAVSDRRAEEAFKNRPSTAAPASINRKRRAA